jgi:hypothetical protein
MQAEAVRSWFREYFVLLEAKAASGGVAAMAGLAHALAAAQAERGEAEAALARTSADQTRLAERLRAMGAGRGSPKHLVARDRAAAHRCPVRQTALAPMISS